MTTDAFVGNIYLERGDTGSPVAYTRVCQVYGISGLGQENALIDATTLCSGGSAEYINGLADGSEITINANFETAAQVLRDMIGDVKLKRSRDFRLVADDVVHPAVNFYFRAVCKSWELAPSVDSKNAINFGLKISGDIDIQVDLT